MGRTLPSITQSFITEQESFGRFRRALRRSDQLALDEIFGLIQQHRAALANAANLLPLEALLVLLLLEEHKRATHICEQLYSEIESLKRDREISKAGEP